MKNRTFAVLTLLLSLSLIGLTWVCTTTYFDVKIEETDFTNTYDTVHTKKIIKTPTIDVNLYNDDYTTRVMSLDVSNHIGDTIDLLIITSQNSEGFFQWVEID
tara:strand:- start:821 stop:1129 length:309 start_codon:yes stop_codon:yes gene_type:complete